MSCENVNKSLIQFLVQEIDSKISAAFYVNVQANGFAVLIDKGTRVEFGQRTISGKIQFIPAKYKGYGDYEYVGFTDMVPLSTYHRLIDFSQEEDSEKGYGKNPLVTQKYKMRLISFGNQRLVKETDFDINYQVAQDISNLIRARLNKASLKKISAQLVAIKPGDINYDKNDVYSNELSPDEVKVKPESILFSIDYEIELQTQNVCSGSLCDLITAAPAPAPAPEPACKKVSELTCEELTDPVTGLQPEQIENCFAAISTNAAFVF